VIISADIDTISADGGQCLVGFAVSGASSIAASDTQALSTSRGSMAAQVQASATYMVTGLTAGSNTFTLQYRNAATAATCTIEDRSITVIGF